jgi:hypothetical protein
MSDNFMIVLPVDPFAIPPKARAEATLALLEKLRADAQEFELYQSDTPDFFHCGGNFDAVYCPFCQTDLTDWWIEAMNAASHENPQLLSVTTSCCSRVTSLNDLDYDWPQGFACVAFSLMNPDSELEPEEIQQVEATLGLPVRIIWMHI